MKLLIFSEAMTQNPAVIAKNVTEPCIWIAIASAGYPSADISEGGHIKAIHRSWFDDARPDDQWSHDKVCMTELQAELIVAFVNKHKDDVGLICVNCHAGICRSSAVAMAISQWLNGHDSGILDSDQYYPNSHVLKMMTKAIKDIDTTSHLW